MIVAYIVHKKLMEVMLVDKHYSRLKDRTSRLGIQKVRYRADKLAEAVSRPLPER